MNTLKIISTLINAIVGILTIYKFIKQIPMDTISPELFLWTIGFLLLTIVTLFIYLLDKIISLKKFRDFESKGQQKYNSMLLSTLDHIFTTANIWKKGQPKEFDKIKDKYLDELIEEKIKDYNKKFKWLDKEYKREQ